MADCGGPRPIDLPSVHMVYNFDMSTEMAIPLAMGEDGVIRIGKTRVTLDSVIYAFQDGATPEEIAIQYPSLDLSDIYLVVGYYLKHQAEVRDYLQERERISEEVRQLNESRFHPAGIRERLILCRQRSSESDNQGD